MSTTFIKVTNRDGERRFNDDLTDHAALRKEYPFLAALVLSPAPRLGTRLDFRGFNHEGAPYEVKIEVSEVISAEELGNNNGYRCPRCLSGQDLSIIASEVVRASLIPDGTDNSGGDTEWTATSDALCGCGWQGTVGQFILVEVEEE